MKKQVIIIGENERGRLIAETIERSVKDADVLIIASPDDLRVAEERFMQFPDKEMNAILKTVKRVGFEHKSKFF